ncbi:MAG: SPOR domain-containing protein [Gemmatimonadota bacterium]
MTERAATGGVRERDERDARFLAWDVPGDAHIVALVHEAGDSERSATVADAIATSVARRREHTLLLSAEPGPSPLDELLGAAGSRGLPAALEGRARLTDVAVQRVDRPFVYLPAGSDAAAIRSLLEDPVLASFVDRVRERGGTLFIVLSEETLRLDGLRILMDGYVALGDVDLPETAAGLVQFGRVRYDNSDRPDSRHGNGGPSTAGEGLPKLPPLPEPMEPPPVAAATPPESVAIETPTPTPAAPNEPGAAPGDALAAPDDVAADSSSDGWQRPRKTPAFPTRKVAVGAGGILGVAAISWMILGGFGGDADASAGGNMPDGQTVAPPTRVTPSPDNSLVSSFDESVAVAAFDAAPELGYSVMIASFAAAADADDRLRQLRSAGSGFYFVSPTPVRGLVYHRVFAGALSTRDEARDLMDALVASGVKGEAGAWHLRPATFAFDFGVFADRAAADRRIDELASRAIPAYALAAAAESDTVWRVFGGAYVDEREAVPMGELLSAAGEPAELITRRGAVP